MIPARDGFADPPALVVRQDGLAAVGGPERVRAGALAEHLAERCALVVIIALGESVLVTRRGLAERERTTQTVLAGGLDRFERIASADVFALLAVLGLAAQVLSRSRWPSAPPRS